MLAVIGAGVGSIAGCVGAPEPGSEPIPVEERPDLGSDLETDTSGDGIPDLVLQQLDFDPDPYRKNVFLEVHHGHGIDPDPLLENAERILADAPIENLDGTNGIDLHVVGVEAVDPDEYSQSPVSRRTGCPGNRMMDHEYRGTRHLLVLENERRAARMNDRFGLTAAPGWNEKLANLLVSHLGGSHHPWIDAPTLWPENLDEPTSIDDLDWTPVKENLAETTPSTRYYEEQYAHLADGRDVQILDEAPTDPDSDIDTSGDGIPDIQFQESDLFADADPLRKNIFLEVDYTTGLNVDRLEELLDRIRKVFADAPVRNPDGSMGIDFHYTIDDELDIEGEIGRRELDQLASEHFDRKGRGHYYLIVGGRVRNLRGFASRELMMSELFLETILHEIGHALELGPSFDGVDSRKYSFEEYPSVMNYNRPSTDICTFATDVSDPDVPDDWSVIDDYLDRVPNWGFLDVVNES